MKNGEDIRSAKLTETKFLNNLAVVSFGDGNLAYRRASRRVVLHSSAFSNVISGLAISKKDLIREFPVESNFISWEKPFLGYYGWKPLSLLFALKKLPSDVQNIFYVDSGCWVNVTESSKVTLSEYIKKSNEFSGLTFGSGEGNLEKMYCKQEVINALKPAARDIETEQRAAGLFLLRRDKAEEVAKVWWEFSCNQSLINDDFDPLIQNSTFVSPRRDQSIFSLIVKKDNLPLCSDRIDIHPASCNISELQRALPFWASRHRSGSNSMSMNPARRATRAIEQLIP